MNHATDAADKERMAGEADFAFRQAWALCPSSPEATSRYVDFLKSRDRAADAGLVTAVSAKCPKLDKSDSPKAHEQAGEPSKSSVFEVRLVVDAASDDAERMTLVQQSSDSGPTLLEPVFVQKTPLLDRSDVQSAKFNRDGLGDPKIEITFTDKGRERFAEITRRNIVNVGHCDRREGLRGSLRPVGYDGSDRGDLGSFSDQEAQALADKINGAIAP